MKQQTPIITWLYRLACYLLAAVCMIYMTITLANYLQIDPVGYLPSVGQWLIGLFLAVLLFVNRRGWLQSFNLLYLAGLAGLVAIY